MPYTMYWHQYGALKKFRGIVSMSEMLMSLSKVQSHPSYDIFRFTITDFLEVESIDFHEPDMLIYGARAIGGQFTNKRLAIGIVVTDLNVIEVLKTRYEPLVNYEVGYFPTLKECESWITEKTQTLVQFSAVEAVEKSVRGF